VILRRGGHLDCRWLPQVSACARRGSKPGRRARAIARPEYRQGDPPP